MRKIREAKAALEAEALADAEQAERDAIGKPANKSSSPRRWFNATIDDRLHVMILLGQGGGGSWW